MKIKVKWLRENFAGTAIRVRYAKKKIFFPKKVLINWDDQKHYFYNEEFELEVQNWFMKKLAKG